MNLMTLRSFRTCAALFLIALIAPLARAADKPSLQSQAQELFSSLTPEQRKEALLPYDSPERNAEVFPGGKRAGIQLKTLPEKQREQEPAATGEGHGEGEAGESVGGERRERRRRAESRGR